VNPYLSLLVVYGGLVPLGALLQWCEHAAARAGATGAPAAAKPLDAGYWLFSPLVTGPITRAATWGAVLLLGWALGWGSSPASVLEAISNRPFALLAGLDLAPQLLLSLLLGDLVGYWSHRWRHHWSLLWDYHAIHHSPKQLRWFHGARMHPGDDVVDNVAVGMALLALGVGPATLALHGPILLLHTIYLHADVPWTLGPLRYVLVSPRMHRRHHQVSVHGEGCNFAGMFSLLDHAFGTWQDPEEEFEGGGAIRCGVDGRSIPETLAGQLADPVARTLRALQASSQRRASR